MLGWTISLVILVCVMTMIPLDLTAGALIASGLFAIAGSISLNK